jgi:primosomal protein N' (replication factor Y)
MVNMRFEGTDGERVREAADQFARNMVARDLSIGKGPMILGPAPAPIERIKGRERWQMLLRGNDRALLHEFVRRAQAETTILGRSPQLRIVVDVDPYNML